MHLMTYLRLLADATATLTEAYRQVAAGHPQDFDVHYACLRFAGQGETRSAALASMIDAHVAESERLPEFGGPRTGPLGLLRDMQDLYQLASAVDITSTLVGQAAQAARDRDLMAVVARCNQQVAGELAWLKARMKAEAPQALLVGS